MDADARRTRVAVAVAFAAQGLGFAVVTTHLPAFQSNYGINDTAVTIVLFAVAVLAGVGTWRAELISSRRGSAAALRLSLLVITGGLAIIAVAPDTVVLYAGFAVYGVGVGGLDASENMQAVEVGRRRVEASGALRATCCGRHDPPPESAPGPIGNAEGARTAARGWKAGASATITSVSTRGTTKPQRSTPAEPKMPTTTPPTTKPT